MPQFVFAHCANKRAVLPLINLKRCPRNTLTLKNALTFNINWTGTAAVNTSAEDWDQSEPHYKLF